MRFLVTGEERKWHDPQEEIAMLRHRMRSLEYWSLWREMSGVNYYFRSQDGRQIFMLYEGDSAQELDRILKADPLLPYLQYSVNPVISTRDLIEEAQGYLGEKYFSEIELKRMEARAVEVDDTASYILVHKWQPPFSPLLGEDIQLDILRRTITSQRAHETEIEISDVNPVGSSIGVHVSKVSHISEARAPVEKTEIFPDTKVKYIKLSTIPQARAAAKLHLVALGRD